MGEEPGNGMRREQHERAAHALAGGHDREAGEPRAADGGRIALPHRPADPHRYAQGEAERDHEGDRRGHQRDLVAGDGHRPAMSVATENMQTSRTMVTAMGVPTRSRRASTRQSGDQARLSQAVAG